jgi:hypothetical protein
VSTKEAAKESKTSKGASTQEAAEAFLLLHDSGNYDTRSYDLLLGQLRTAVLGTPAPEDTEELDELTATVLQQNEEGTLISGDHGPVLAAKVKEAVAKRDADAETADK